MLPETAAPSISIVVPAYNEEATIEATVERCLASLRQCTRDFELVILDDGSRDRTGELMEEIRAQHPDVVRTIVHAENRGIAASFEEAYRAARKDYVLLIPADGQYPPEALVETVPLLGMYDIVVFNRTVKTYTPLRMLVSRAYRWLPLVLFGVDLHDPGSCKCLRREVIRDIPVTSRGVFAEAERVIRASRRGYRIGRVDIVQREREAGRAMGANPRMVVEGLVDLGRLWLSLVVLCRNA